MLYPRLYKQIETSREMLQPKGIFLLIQIQAAGNQFLPHFHLLGCYLFLPRYHLLEWVLGNHLYLEEEKISIAKPQFWNDVDINFYT